MKLQHKLQITEYLLQAEEASMRLRILVIANREDFTGPELEALLSSVQSIDLALETISKTRGPLNVS